NEIRIKHNIGKTFFPNLSFHKIYSIITDTKKYQADYIRFVRKKFYESWLEAQKRLETKKQFTDSHLDKIDIAAKSIYHLKDKNFIQFLKNINPDKYNVNELDSLDDLLDLCKIETLKEVFYECIAQVTKEIFKVEFQGYNVHGGYLLTLISNRPGNIDEVVKSMAKNEHVTKNLFDRRYLINDRINEKLIHEYIEGHADGNWGDKVNSSDIFFHPELEFVDLESAITKLNGGN